MRLSEPPKITDKQLEFIRSLFMDFGFTHDQRKAWLTAQLNRPIVYSDELTKAEASLVIGWLLEMRFEKEGY